MVGVFMGRFVSIASKPWEDIRQGRDIELYATVPLAFAVVAANVFDWAPARFVSAVTLAVLTLLVIALLRLRRQTDELQTALRSAVSYSDGSVDRFFRPDQSIEEVRDLIRSAREEVWLWGSTLSMHVSILAPHIEQEVARGLKIRILMIEPGPSTAMRMATIRARHATDEELQHGLTANLYRLGQTATRLATRYDQVHGGRMEVRVIDYLAPYALYAYDPHLPSGRLDVRLSGIAIDDDYRPGFTVTSVNGGIWYQHFKQQFEAAWASATQRIPAPAPGANQAQDGLPLQRPT